MVEKGKIPELNHVSSTSSSLFRVTKIKRYPRITKYIHVKDIFLQDHSPFSGTLNFLAALVLASPSLWAETHISLSRSSLSLPGRDTCKQPIRTRYLGHVTGYQPIRDQYFLVKGTCTFSLTLTKNPWPTLYMVNKVITQNSFFNFGSSFHSFMNQPP
eukprot:sb/3473022/